jgi:hypothetical protein
MYAIFDTCDLSRPFVFQDQDKGTQEPAIFESQSKADQMAHIMNSVIKDHTFIVKGL